MSFNLLPARAPAPLLLALDEAASLCHVCFDEWWEANEKGLVPRPVRFCGRDYWVAEELREWTAAGCPPRARWERMRKGGGHDPGPS